MSTSNVVLSFKVSLFWGNCYQGLRLPFKGRTVCPQGRDWPARDGAGARLLLRHYRLWSANIWDHCSDSQSANSSHAIYVNKNESPIYVCTHITSVRLQQIE